MNSTLSIKKDASSNPYFTKLLAKNEKRIFASLHRRPSASLCKQKINYFSWLKSPEAPRIPLFKF